MLYPIMIRILGVALVIVTPHVESTFRKAGKSSGIKKSLGRNAMPEKNYDEFLQTKSMRISGGTVLEPHAYGSIARLIYKGFHTCGATIYNREFILTAAQCLTFKDVIVNKKHLEVHVGDHRPMQNGTSVLQKLKVTRIILHEKYNESAYPFVHDIAVLQVDPLVRFNNKITPSNIPHCQANDTEFNKGPATAVGWTYDSTSDTPVNLQAIQVAMFPNEDCLQIDPKIDFNWGTRMCSIAPEGSGTCIGDAGGPLYVTYNNETYQVGIISSYKSRKDCNTNMYTRLSYYVGWLYRRTIGCGNHPYSYLPIDESK